MANPADDPTTHAPAATLSRRELNRAALRRQLLLHHGSHDLVGAVEAIGGLNAQDPNDAYLALASRLDGFLPARLTAAIERGDVLRAAMMRGTQHLMSAADVRVLRPVLQPLLTRVQRNAFGRRTAGVDLAALATDARRVLAGGVHSRTELGRALAASRPGSDGNALAWSAQYLLPIVHPAPAGTWNYRGPTPCALADVDQTPDPRQLVRRHLAAFGPATTADIRSWSGVGGLREVVAGMRDELRAFRDEAGRELLDLPDAPRPEPGTPVPVRFLPAFDNLVLGYADRGRLMTEETRRRVCVPDLVRATVLVDGTVAGTWQLDSRAATLTVQPFHALTGPEVDDVEHEARRLLELTTPRHTHEVRVLPPG